MEIKVCIGSACHLKGSYEVISIFKNYIASHDYDQRIVLKSSFCLGKCSDAVSVQVDNERIFSVSPESAQMFIELLGQQVIGQQAIGQQAIGQQTINVQRVSK